MITRINKDFSNICSVFTTNSVSKHKYSLHIFNSNCNMFTTNSVSKHKYALYIYLILMFKGSLLRNTLKIIKSENIQTCNVFESVVDNDNNNINLNEFQFRSPVSVLWSCRWTRPSPSRAGRPVVLTIRRAWRSYGTPKWFKRAILHLIIITGPLKYEFKLQWPRSRTFTNQGDHHKQGNQYYQSCRCYSLFHCSVTNPINQ
jgi:hypothetical protein